MLCTIQTRGKKLRLREGIPRSKHGRGHLLQASFQKTQIKDGVLRKLVTVPTSQIFAVRVGQHMRPPRNSNERRWTTHSSHNWPQHWYLVCWINGKKVCNSHSNPTECAFLPCPHEGPQWLTTLLEFKAVKWWTFAQPTTRDRIPVKMTE